MSTDLWDTLVSCTHVGARTHALAYAKGVEKVSHKLIDMRGRDAQKPLTVEVPEKLWDTYFSGFVKRPESGGATGGIFV